MICGVPAQEQGKSVKRKEQERGTMSVDTEVRSEVGESGEKSCFNTCLCLSLNSTILITPKVNVFFPQH